MEAFVLPLLALALVGALIYGFSENRPTIEEDEAKALMPLLRALHRADGGLPEGHPGLGNLGREVEHALARGYVRRSSRDLLVLTPLGDRLRRTGKLAAVSAPGST